MPTEQTTIKSYSDYASKWSEHMNSGNNYAHTYLEKPAMKRYLQGSNLDKVLCIGCGTGEECQMLIEEGAREVIGIDLSPGLIEQAKKNFPSIEFKVMDMEELDFNPESFTLIYSSLTLHYILSWDKVLDKSYSLLQKGGSFLFSVNHPTKWGAEKRRTENQSDFIMGYRKDKRNNTCEVYGDYFNTRLIKDKWFNEMDVSYYHRPLDECIKDILNSDFKIKAFEEPRATDKAEEGHKIFWEIHKKLPLFMIFELYKD